MRDNALHQTAATLVRGGFAVIPLKYGEKRPMGDRWTETVTTVDSIVKWPERVNVGVLTERTPAVDLDILDPALAQAMEAWILEHCGEAPVRIGRAPKRLLVFRAEAPFRKVTSRVFLDAAGQRHRVEILGQGQQFVAFGLHPDTQRDYDWPHEELTQFEREDLPLIDLETAQRIVAEFERRALKVGWTPEGAAANGHARGDDDLWFLNPKPDVTLEEMREAVALFANPGRDYDLWLKVGAALHHQFDGKKEGLDLWLEWSARSPHHDDAYTEKTWSYFGRYEGRPVTVAFILKATHEARKAAREVREKAAKAEARTTIRTAIAAATDSDALLEEVLPMVAAGTFDTPTEQALLGEIANRHKALSGTKPTAWALARRVKELRAEKAAAAKDAAPEAVDILQLEYRLGQRVLAEHYNGGRHLKTFSRLWWEFRGGVWARTEETAIKGRIQATLLNLASAQDEDLRALLNATVESRGDRLSALVNTVLATIESAIGEDGMVDPLRLSSKDAGRVINCLNGELWFSDTGKLKLQPHNPDHLLTAQISCVYDPKATCPTWDASIRKVFSRSHNREEVIRHFEEVMGYVIQPTRHVAVWVMVKGPGGNGKSFLTDIISEVMGTGSVMAASFAELSNGPSTHFTDALQGKLMFLDDDLKTNVLLADDWVKKLSEAKLITANPKFARAYNFVARSIPVLLTNSWPSTTDLTIGLRRRAMIFESEHILTEEEKDPRHMQQILEHELPGVLNRLVAGFQRFLARGQRFDPPEESRQSLQTWLSMSNPTALFAAHVLEKTGQRSDYLKGEEIYNVYANWARHWEGSIKVLGRNKFYEALFKLGFDRVSHGNVTTFSGVKINKVEGLEHLFLTNAPFEQAD